MPEVIHLDDGTGEPACGEAIAAGDPRHAVADDINDEIDACDQCADLVRERELDEVTPFAALRSLGAAT